MPLLMPWRSDQRRSLRTGRCCWPVKHRHECHAQGMRQLVKAWFQRHQGKRMAGTLTRLRHLSLRSTLLRVGWKVARCCSRMSAQLPVPAHAHRVHQQRRLLLRPANVRLLPAATHQQLSSPCLTLTRSMGRQNADAQCAILQAWRSSTLQASDARLWLSQGNMTRLQEVALCLMHFVLSACSKASVKPHRFLGEVVGEAACMCWSWRSAASCCACSPCCSAAAAS